MKSNAKHYTKLREYLETIPLFDCHDHTTACGPKYTDPISVIASGYFVSDLHSASSDSDIEIIQDSTLSIEERWGVLEKAWNRSCHTGYANVTKLVLKKFYDEAWVKKYAKELAYTSDKRYHYNGSGRSYYEMGQSMGNAMVELLKCEK